jgi:hypothetical protein
MTINLLINSLKTFCQDYNGFWFRISNWQWRPFFFFSCLAQVVTFSISLQDVASMIETIQQYAG